MAAVTSARARDARRTLARISRSLRGRGREMHWFHQADDSYRQLAAQTLRALVAPPSDAATPERALLVAHHPGVTRDFFLSLRSPYSDTVTERGQELAKHSGATLALKPVLPMVMRGLPVPARQAPRHRARRHARGRGRRGSLRAPLRSGGPPGFDLCPHGPG
jgi:2-hydroxychromene-2-carboxylate isomerase